MAQIGRFVQQTLENDLEGKQHCVRLARLQSADIFHRLLLLAVESSS